MAQAGPAAAREGQGYFVRRMIAYRPLRYSSNAVCWILYHSWYLVLGLLAMLFFDTLQHPGSTGFTLAGVVVLVLLAGLAKTAILYLAWLAGAPWGFMLRRLLQRNLFSAVFRRPGASALPGTVGEAFSTMRDDVEIIALQTDWVFDLIAAAIFAAGGIIILLQVDVQVTLLVFAPIVAILLVAHAAKARLERVRVRSRLATAQVTGMIGEIFGGVQTIQVAGAERAIDARLRQLGEIRRRMMLRDRLVGLALDATFASTASIGTGLTLLVAGAKIRSGSFTIGDLALFATYLMQVARLTRLFGYLINTYRQSNVAFDRAIELMQGAPSPQLVAHEPLYLDGRRPPPIMPRPRTESDRLARLDVRGLTVRHAGGDRGIADVSFTVGRGQLVVVTGRIGAGKTTLLRAILGLLDSDGGQICWNGEPLASPADVLVPPRAAYVPQVPTLLSGSLRDNILLGLPASPALTRAVHLAALDRDVEAFPRGLDTAVGTRGTKLSGGQVQRAATARMLVREPELLVVDDLSSALDGPTERLLWDRLRRAGATCLAASHQRAVLEQADHIVVLADGRVAAQGAFGDLIESSPEFRDLYGQRASVDSAVGPE